MNTGHSRSQLRSGAEHWPQRLAVEVRQGTLAADDCGGGPAENTRRGRSRLTTGREHWRGGSRLRSDSAATKRKDEGGKRKDEGGRREKTDKKSNNPHLTGGEKPILVPPNLVAEFCWMNAGPSKIRTGCRASSHHCADTLRSLPKQQLHF